MVPPLAQTITITGPDAVSQSSNYFYGFLQSRLLRPRRLRERLSQPPPAAFCYTQPGSPPAAPERLG